ncbi:MAG: hypothetical protein GX053_12815 [Tissierella sp.]|nr:hypothetical protein [Tissierella sp.]
MDWNKIKDSAKDLATKGMEASKDLAEKKLEESKEKKEQKKLEEQELKDRIKQMDKEGIVYCPKCYSNQITANKKGFSLGKAAAGSLIAGGVLLGAVGKNKIEVTCLKCGNKWKAGKK